MKYHGISLAEGSTISNMTLVSGTSFPSSPSVGEMFYRSDENKVYVYDDGVWSAVSTGASEYTAGVGITINSATIAAPVYDFAFSIPGTMSSGTQFVATVTRPCSLPLGLTGSMAKGLVAATDTTVMTIFKKAVGQNPVSIGSIVFNTGTATGSFIFLTATSFAAGDMLYLSLDTADSTLADVSVTLNGTLV